MLKNNKTGILFWVTGLSGSGKSAISNRIIQYVRKNFGSTIILSGDEFRKIFNIKSYDKKSRIKNLIYYQRFIKSITSQNINILFNVVGMINKARIWNKKNIDNYLEIYIKSDIQKIIKFSKKNLYKKNKKNIVGLDIKAELPSKPDITIENDFVKSIDYLAEELKIKLNKLKLRGKKN